MKRKMLGIFLFLLSFSLYSFEPQDVVYEDCKAPQPEQALCEDFPLPKSQAKNIILFIGDGMGINQIYTARVYQNGPDQPLELEQFEEKSLIRTCSLTGITDSGAAGTALATGHKTLNTRIGVDPKGNPLTSILELARLEGKSVGLVTTDQVVGATPATFALHKPNRYNFSLLAQDYLSARPDLLLGGGRKWFLRKERGGSLIKKAEQIGYLVVFDRKQLKAVPEETVRLLGLFALREMTYVFDRTPETSEPELKEMTQTALKLLSHNPEGFFLMVEGARIDHACHRTDLKRSIYEVLSLNQAVIIAKDFQKTHPDTLILLTADHETGGLEVIPGEYKKGELVRVKWSRKILPLVSAFHSSQRVPLFGSGPGAELVPKADDNTEVFCIILRAFGINPPREKEEEKCPCENFGG